MNKNSVMIVAGGTAGHVFPAIELAKEYLQRGECVTFITDERAYSLIFSKMSFSSKVQIYKFKIRGLIKDKYFYNLKSLFLLFLFIVNSFSKFIFNKPKLVFGFGGYVTVAPILVCKFFLIPIILHEGNKVIGKANKFLIKYSTRFTYFFDKIEGVKKNSKFINIGMPIRNEIEKLHNKKYHLSKKNKLNILITGGSLGAEVMALNIAKAISKLPIDSRSKIKIFQQVRKENKDYVKNLYLNSGIDFKIEEFINNYSEVLEWCHLVICRCGSGTLSENLVSGRPSIMLPLKSSADNHQYKNAKFIEEIGAGWIVNDEELNNDLLLLIKLQKLFFNEKNLILASKKAKSSVKIGASKRLADLGISIMVRE